MSRKMKITGALLALMIVGVTASAQLGAILKGGGIAFLVSQFGGEIDKAINGLTKTNMHSSEYSTKVVPIISAGDGTEAGAVQVMGPRAAVNKVQAVAQVEGNFKRLGFRVRAMIPISTKSITNIKRVPGVGISGLIDVRL
jgi:hypothetical protein